MIRLNEVLLLETYTQSFSALYTNTTHLHTNADGRSNETSTENRKKVNARTRDINKTQSERRSLVSHSGQGLACEVIFVIDVSPVGSPTKISQAKLQTPGRLATCKITGTSRGFP